MTVLVDKSLANNRRIGTIVERLRLEAQTQPQTKIYTYLRHGETETRHLSYGELDRQARAVASQLQQRELAGTSALLLYQAGLDFIIALFGCWYAGVVAVPAYPPRRNQNLSRLEAIITNAGASVILSTSTLRANLQSHLPVRSELEAKPWILTDRLTASAADSWQPTEIAAESLALLQYTSGSTGTPKGVTISHDNLWHNLGAIYQHFGHQSTSRGVIWLPQYHDMGLIGGVLQPLYGGFEVTLMSSIDFLQKPWRWLQAITSYRATTSGGPNFAYDLCARKITPSQLAQLDLSSWEVAFTGAEPVRAETIELFSSTFAVCGFRREAFYPCYGMAEATLIVTGGVKTKAPVIRSVATRALENNLVVESEPNTDSRQLVSCGHSLPDQQLMIVDPDSCTQCPSERVGEIWVAGPSVARGYWQRPQATEQTFCGYLADTGAGPFLRTGDLGFINDGELYVTGRIKDVIIIRGQNHYPSDIERTVENSHPALRPGCGAAFGVDIEGRERLVVVQEVKRTYLRRLNADKVLGQLCQAVAAQHGLQVYAAVLVKTGSIPKTSSGKIRRYACRTGFEEGSLKVVSDWSENPKSKAEFRHLWAETESLLAKLEAQ